ncbi:FecR family protein [Runella sp. MFBS21]|uniref:FecR family protein n=1 Tax=Runella sp. MFBS21 TaxID=3034018 RepID=UPI0023F65B73|nr:FecR family protein [Runella sp. MFBS21]MDF7819984.1 FecR family protein [Runella sp. MFBS21]
MQKRDQYHTIEDFLTDVSFQRWIREGENDENWVEWSLENTQRAKLVEEARLWILATAVPIPPSNLTQTALQNTWDKIQLKEKELEPTFIASSNRLWWWSAAAIVIVGLGIGWVFYQQNKTKESLLTYSELISQTAEGLIEQTNNTNKPQLITLSDGSSVLLYPKSKLSYPRSFAGSERKVFLLGEGFFEISKNPKKPFLVFSNEVVTKVVGTSFRIRAFSNQPNIEVTVKTGQVNVESNDLITKSEKKSVTLLPNEGIRFLRQGLSFEKMATLPNKDMSAPSTYEIEQVNFEFSDTPVSQIFAILEEAYLLEIDFPAEKLKDCYLTTSLQDQPLPEKLKIICESLGKNTRYEMNGNQIIILSNGCN